MNAANCHSAKRLQKTHKTDEMTQVFHRESKRFSDELHHNLNSTPLGKLLGAMAELPEIRHEKVIRAKNRIKTGEMDHHIDAAMDRMLEELLSE